MNIRTLSAIVLTSISFCSLPAAAQDNISINIKNGDIKDVLLAVAKLSDKNIITDNSVSGNISISFTDVPLSSALNLITASKGLAYRDINNVIVVSSASNLNHYNNTVTALPLNYIQAKDIEEMLKNLLPDCRLTTDPVSNTILFTGSASDEQKLRDTLKAVDIPTKQITLEARIIAVNEDASKNLGVNWSWDTIPQKDSSASNTDSENDNSDNYEGQFKFWHGYSFNFNATLNALITNGQAKILATPRIITIPGKEASIFIGDHIPVQTEKHSSGDNYTSTEYVDAGIKLIYTPIVDREGNMVTAAVHTEVSTPTLISELQNYKITSRTADTNVRMLSGETLVIGGLINEEEQKSIQKVPFLSNIPILGELFKNRTSRKNKTEVFMILTPHITEAGFSPAIYNSKNIITEQKQTTAAKEKEV